MIGKVIMKREQTGDLKSQIFLLYLKMFESLFEFITLPPFAAEERSSICFNSESFACLT